MGGYSCHALNRGCGQSTVLERTQMSPNTICPVTLNAVLHADALSYTDAIVTLNAGGNAYAEALGNLTGTANAGGFGSDVAYGIWARRSWRAAMRSSRPVA